MGNYVGAPFNFVPFNDKVVPVDEEQMNVRGSFKKEQYTGEISYTLTAKTPICIDDGQGKFFRNEYNEIAIPGSSMRGLIRNNVQVLGLSGFADDIDDYTLMYRDVTGGMDKEFYKEILDPGKAPVGGEGFSILKNVSAGYISCEEDKYYIYKTDVDSLGDGFACMNYYVISARKILEDLDQYPFFRSNPDCLMYSLDCEFVRVVKFKGINGDGKELEFSYETDNALKELKKKEKFYYCGTSDGKKIIIEKFSDRPIEGGEEGECSTNPMVHYVPKDNTKGENNSYTPYCKKVLYQVSKGKNITGIKEYNAEQMEGYLEGYLLGTGNMEEKKALYIIPKINEQKDRIEIQEQDVKAYQVDYRKRESTLVSRVEESNLKKKLSQKIKAFFDLPEEGEKKPIFYIEPNKNCNVKRLYFGYTPRLRLFYAHSVKEGYHQELVTYDYAKSIFGTAESKEKMLEQGGKEGGQEIRKAYRSKVSFTDAILQKKPQYEKNYNLILAEPKPSSFFDYIEQEGQVTTYNTENFNLRGVKQYWLADSLHQLPRSTGKNENVPSSFQPLKENGEFIGAVRFQNLSKEELGLLLWSIRLQDNSRMNIGKAKSYGFGVISISDIKVKTVDLEKAYSLDNPLSLDPFIEEDVDELIDSYKDTINKKLDGKTIDQLEHIRDFFAMKNYEHLPKQTSIRFMSIDNKDYQNRRNSREPLATIQEVLSGKRAESVQRRAIDGSNNSNTSPNERNFEFSGSGRRERSDNRRQGNNNSRSGQRYNNGRTSNRGNNGTRTQNTNNHRQGNEVETAIVQPYKKSNVIRFKIGDRRVESIQCGKVGISPEKAQEEYPPGIEIKVRFRGVEAGTGYRKFEIIR